MKSKIYVKHARSPCRLQDRILVECLNGLLQLPGLAPVYIIVDGLDGCQATPCISGIPAPREKVLSLIRQLVESFPNLHVCVTSRPEIDIKNILDPLLSHSVSLHDESGHKGDIENYIKLVVNTHPKNRGWKAEDKQLVIGVLTEKANGM